MRHRNDGLSKICECPHGRWPKCPHGWHFNFKWDGRHYRFSLDRHVARRLTTKSDAKAEADRIRTDIRSGNFRSPHDRPTTRDALTVDAFGAIFLERYSKARQKATWRDDEMLIEQITAFIVPGPRPQRLGDMSLSAVTEDALELFMQSLRQRGRAASTRNHYVQMLTAMFRWAVRKGYLDRNPITEAAAIAREQIARRYRRLQGDEEPRLLATAHPRLQRLIIAAIETGCRLRELLTLQWCDVDLDGGLIQIRAEHTKKRRARPVPISNRLAAVLEMARLDPAGDPHGPLSYVFGDEIGRRIKSPKTAWRSACRRAGIVNLRFHDLRHEAGSRLHELGWPLHHVRDLLGHASVSTTNTYLNVTRAELVESMRRADEARNRCKIVASWSENGPRPPCNDEQENAENTLLH